jgi:hypothetical protein
MKVLIHAGLPKTGSTAIQHALIANQDVLREQGVLHPQFESERDWAGQWQLAAFWYPYIDPTDEVAVAKRFASHGGARFAEETIAFLGTTLSAAKSGGMDVVLSAEFLGSPSSPPGLATLREFLRDFTDDIHLLAYLRPPLDLFSSSVQQNLKRSHGPLTEKFRDHPNRARRMVEAFGMERTTIRVFSRSLLRDGDAIADFWNWLSGATGRSLTGLRPGEPANESLSAPACAILARLRRHKPDSEGADRTYSQARRLLQEFAADRADRRLVVPEDWRPRIVASVGGGWNDMLGLAAHTEAEKAQFILPLIEGLPAVSEAEVLEWLLSQHDKDFAEAFASYCRSRPEPWAARAASAVRGVV